MPHRPTEDPSAAHASAKPRVVRITRALALALAAWLLLSVAAQPAGAADVAEAPRAEHELSRAQAITLVEHRYAARVVRASSIEDGGRHVYVFRLLSAAGKVWEVRIDARNGTEVH